MTESPMKNIKTDNFQTQCLKSLAAIFKSVFICVRIKGLKNNLKKPDICLNKLLFELGQKSYEFNHDLSEKFNIDFSEAKTICDQAEYEAKAREDILIDSTKTLEEKKVEFDISLDEQNLKLAELKLAVKKAQKDFTAAHDKLNHYIEVEKARSDKFRVLTVLQDKIDPQKTIQKLARVVETYKNNRDSFNAELSDIEGNLSRMKSDWNLYKKDIEKNINLSKQKLAAAVRIKDAAELKFSDCFKTLGEFVHKEDSYAHTVLYLKDKIIEVKEKIEHLNSEIFENDNNLALLKKESFQGYVIITIFILMIFLIYFLINYFQ